MIPRTGLTFLLAPVLLSGFFMHGCSKRDEFVSPSANSATVVTDVAYGKNINIDGISEDLTLDLYFPRDTTPGKQYPLVVFIHGGGYLSGDKKSARDKCSVLADSGFVTAAINYRLGWDKGSGQCNGNETELENAGYRALQDANAAIRFLVANARQYDIDPNWIFVAGSSAGAITALCTGYFDDATVERYYPLSFRELGGISNAGNNLAVNYTIRGISSISGGLPDSNLVNRPDAVPVIFFHGTEDETIPLESGYFSSCTNYSPLSGSLSLYRVLSGNKIPSVLHLLPGAGHGRDGDSGFTDEFKMSNTACFFHSLMRKELPPSGIYTGVENSCR